MFNDIKQVQRIGTFESSSNLASRRLANATYLQGQDLLEYVNAAVDIDLTDSKIAAKEKRNAAKDFSAIIGH